MRHQEGNVKLTVMYYIKMQYKSNGHLLHYIIVKERNFKKMVK